jgi:hypothetical protein
MSIAMRSRYRTIANRYRRLPGAHGLRPYRVYLVTGAWSSTSTHPFGDGSRTDTTVEILENGEPPKVAEVGDEQIALGVDLTKGDLLVGPITPVAGTAWAALTAGAVTSGQAWRVKLVHDETGETTHCLVKATKKDKALRYILTVSPVRSNA